VRGVSSLTDQFWSRVFGAEVKGGEPQPIGDGLVGANFRVELSSAAGHVPASVVAKMPSADEKSRGAGVAMRTYEREAKFYSELADTVDVRRPQCHHIEYDDATSDFVLVLEDLAPAEQGNQILGCFEDQARCAVRELARLHGPRWSDPRLADHEWLQRRSGAQDAQTLSSIYNMFIEPFLGQFAAYLTADQADLAQRFAAYVSSWVEGRGSEWTVTHGDYRLDNLMFGTVVGEMTVAVVDWQTIGHGPGATDLAYFVGGGVTPDLRRSVEHTLIAEYLDALSAYGVAYSVDDAWRDYVHESFAGVIMSVVASQLVAHTDRGEKMFAAMATRHLQHALDLEALSSVSRGVD
jgi:aminoglycoside/choline kinase family phosphotransferase